MMLLNMNLIIYIYILIISLTYINSLDPSSKEFHFIAQSTYNKVLPCIKFFANMKNNDINWSFPIDAQKHYEELLTKTKSMRNIPIHKSSGYDGPWIENHFIKHFINKPLSYFNGFIPLFIQWTDIHSFNINKNNNSSSINMKYNELKSILKEILRSDVLYLLVVQDDQGITTTIQNDNPNILTLSSGGYGHIPIPLIKGELPYSIPHSNSNKYSVVIGFYGNMRQFTSRYKMLRDLQKCLKTEKKLKIQYLRTNEWILKMKNTKYNLAPRGFGRTSYRLAESIQLGRVPVYMYDDFEWLPYEGSDAHISNFGYIGKMGQAKDLANRIKNTNNDDYNKKINKIKDIRYYYTYEGVINQIEKFISDPFNTTNGCKLKCTTHQLLYDH